MTESTLIARKPSMSGRYGTMRLGAPWRTSSSSGTVALCSYCTGMTRKELAEPRRQQRAHGPLDASAQPTGRDVPTDLRRFRAQQVGADEQRIELHRGPRLV